MMKDRMAEQGREEVKQPSSKGLLPAFPQRFLRAGAALGVAAGTLFGSGKPAAAQNLSELNFKPGGPTLEGLESQEASDFFPVYTVNLGSKDSYNVGKIEDLSNPGSIAYRNISENASYKEFVKKAFVFADIATNMANKKFNVRPAFAITPNNDVLVSGLLLHQDENGNADDYFLFGWEQDKTPVMQRITLNDTQKGKVDIQIRPLKLGDVTLMAPTITDLSTGDVLNFIGNPFKDNDIKPTPAPQNEGGIKDLKLASYKIDKDNKLGESSSESVTSNPGYSLISKEELDRDGMTSGVRFTMPGIKGKIEVLTDENFKFVKVDVDKITQNIKDLEFTEIQNNPLTNVIIFTEKNFVTYAGYRYNLDPSKVQPGWKVSGMETFYPPIVLDKTIIYPVQMPLKVLKTYDSISPKRKTPDGTLLSEYMKDIFITSSLLDALAQHNGFAGPGLLAIGHRIDLKYPNTSFESQDRLRGVYISTIK